MGANSGCQRVLLTGNTGYIGTVMTKFLKSQLYHVTGLDSNWFSQNCFFLIPEDSKPDKQIVKDIRRVTERDLEGIDAVIHLAGLSNDPLGEVNVALTKEINYKATIRIAELCKKMKIERFIFSSSCSIYGIARTDEPINENGCLNPQTAYAKAKVDSELHLARLADEDFHPVFMRNATAYGVSAAFRSDLVVNNLIAWAYLTGAVTIMSDGSPWRPIIHIEDLCRAFITALNAPFEKVHCQAFNAGINEENYQIKDIASEIKKKLPHAKIKIMNRTGPDERTYRVDFSKINDYLPDFTPQWNLQKGIAELLEAYGRHNLTKRDFDSGKYSRISALNSLIRAGRIDKMSFGLTGGKI